MNMATFTGGLLFLPVADFAISTSLLLILPVVQLEREGIGWTIIEGQTKDSETIEGGVC